MAKQRTYGYDRCKLAENYTVSQLVATRSSLQADPDNRTNARYWGGTENTIWLYTPKARKKLENIGWAIYQRQKANQP